MEQKQENEKLVRHLYNIGALQQIETVTPFGITVMKWSLYVLCSFGIAGLLLHFIWFNW